MTKTTLFSSCALALLTVACGGTSPATDAGLSDMGPGDVGVADVGVDAGSDSGSDVGVDMGTDVGTDVGTDAYAGFVPPAGHVAINFSIDDSAHPTYTSASDLIWKGSFAYDVATRTITYDGTWTGPFPSVYDDGPWTTGGHEPMGATADDHVWGTTVWFPSPSSAVDFQYGANSGGRFGTWIWVGANGTFTVPAGATDPITAAPLVIP